MSLLSIDDLLEALTPDEVKATLYAAAEAIGLSPSAWQSGSPTRTIFAVVSRLFSGFTETMVLGIKMGFLDTAEGPWLRLLARVVYKVTAIDATFATGSVVFDNAGGGVYVLDVGDVVVKNETTGKTYTNTEAITIHALETGVECTVQAVEVGGDSTAGAGQITELVTTLLGVTVSNPLAVVGLDQESDPALRQRCRESLAALSPNGPKDAYAYVAKTPELNGNVAVTRVRVQPPPGDGGIEIVIAGPLGAISGGEVALVQAGIDAQAASQTVTATVVSATPLAIGITIAVYISTASGLSTAQVVALVSKRLIDWVNSLPIGGLELTPGAGKVLWRAVEEQAASISPFVLHAVLTPETDIAVASNEIATLDPGDLTVAVHFVVPQ